MTTPAHPIAQAAAVPYRIDEGGQVQVLLIRRFDRPDWGIPKGKIEPGQTARQAAAMEAREEAGLEGQLSERSIGQFLYQKSGRDYHVEVFLMQVTAEHEDYLEKSFRQRQWFDRETAARTVGRETLRHLIASFAP